MKKKTFSDSRLEKCFTFLYFFERIFLRSYIILNAICENEILTHIDINLQGALIYLLLRDN